MLSICSMTGIIDTEHPGQGIRDLKAAGFPGILLDFGVFAPIERVFPDTEREERQYKPEWMKLLYKRVITELKRCQMDFSTAKMPFLSPFTKKGDMGQDILQVDVACLRAFEENEGKDIIVQPLFAGIERGREWETNRKFFLSLAKQCKKKDTRFLLVNQCRNINGHLIRGTCFDGVTTARWIDELNEEAGMSRFGFCLDVGSGNLCGQDMQSMAKSLGKRIKAVILSENNGQFPVRLLPFSNAEGGQSKTDWLNVIRGLRETGFDGTLILEIKDTACAFSPLLRPQLLALCKATADYFVMQIGIENALKKYSSIILFGAGNMCRNYMKCYGDKYPPLFTCDNNSKLWGTEFCGLTVREPEALKNAPEGSGIFICNIFYREIEAQLREMGIKNIEYFNDEYMPSFYFDRLKREETDNA